MFGTGMPELFGLALLLVLVLGVVATLWRVSTARGTAERPGRDVADPAERLRRLTSLLDEGLVSQAEYDERRRAIIDDI